VEKVRDSGRVVRTCLVLADAVHESGYRGVIGRDVGEAVLDREREENNSREEARELTAA
jgi:transposase-like protein